MIIKLKESREKEKKNLDRRHARQSRPVARCRRVSRPILMRESWSGRLRSLVQWKLRSRLSMTLCESGASWAFLQKSGLWIGRMAGRGWSLLLQCCTGAGSGSGFAGGLCFTALFGNGSILNRQKLNLFLPRSFAFAPRTTLSRVFLLRTHLNQPTWLGPSPGS